MISEFAVGVWRRSAKEEIVFDASWASVLRRLVIVMSAGAD
jgi:hypothetical protein